MVCKEEILTWFKDLDSHKRLDMLCELINMCMPFELRFVGSYIEEMGKHSYQELRQQSLTANDVDKLDKDPTLKNQTLYEESIRHRMLINVSLLKSRNYNVANWYSKKFLRTDYIEDLITKEKDDLVQNELLLLYTMAARHPAFSFEQKQFFNSILMQLYELRESRFSKSYGYRYPPGFEYSSYRNMKVHDSNSYHPVGVPTHHPMLVQYTDFMNPHFRSGWTYGITSGAPSEVPPFPPHQTPLQPPQPSTSPLVSSPSQSRSGSPRPVSRPPFSTITSGAPTVALPTNPSGGVVATPITTPVAPVMGTTPVLPAMLPVPIEAPPPMSGQSSQLSPVYGQVKQLQPEVEDLNTTLKEDIPSKASGANMNPWMTASNVNVEPKQINGLRIGPPNFLQGQPVANPTVRNSIADQMQSMALTDESSHYHSSSSSSPLQTPPETPSNLRSTSTPTPPHRGGLLDKNRVNGLPNYLAFGDTTSPPPPAFSFPTYAPLIQPRFVNPSMRPPVTTVLGQFGGPTQAYQQGADSIAPSSFHHNPYPFYFPFMYSSYPPHVPPQQPGGATAGPPNAVMSLRAHPPGCYNCGAATHQGSDCPKQNIDDITQKNTYSIDFSPVNSDSEK